MILVRYTGDAAPQTLDIFSRLLRDRAIMLNGEIHDSMSDLIIAQLFHLESEDSDKDIIMYINSPGGSVTSALAIYDVMRYIRPKVTTVCVGQACSAASFLLCAGDKRYIMPNARILLHQPMGSASGQASDLRIQAAEITRMHEVIKGIYKRHTNIPHSELDNVLDRDTVLTGQSCIDLGLVDEFLNSRKVDVIDVSFPQTTVTKMKKTPVSKERN